MLHPNQSQQSRQSKQQTEGRGYFSFCHLLALLSLSALVPSSAQTAGPALVHSRSLAAPGESGNSFKIQYGGSMGTGTLAGNLLTLRMTYAHGLTVSSIQDNKGSSYTSGVVSDSGSGGWVTALYYVAGVQAGITQITVTYSGATSDWHAAVQEYSGVATSSPVDSTCSNHTTSVQCSMTTMSSGDLIVASTIGLGGAIRSNTMSSVVPGGNFILDAADTQCSDADEEMVQAVAGSITPSFTIGGNSESFNIVAMAFKAVPGAGTNPTGMYILHQQHVQMNTSGSQNTYFVSSGNLVVVSFDLGPQFTPLSISGCTPSNTWTTSTPGTLYPTFLYLPASAAFSTNMHCTVVTNGAGNNGIFVIYDVVGAAASPLDVASAGASGQTTPGGTNTDMPTITPTKQPGIAFAAQNTGIGPATAVGTGFIFDNTPYTGETDGGQLNNGDGWQHYFYNTTSQIAFSWTQAKSAYMQAAAIAFNAASGTPPPPPPPTASPCDVNGDGQVNVADVQKEVMMALQLSPCTNPDNQCTVIQVEDVVNAVLGGQCTVP